MARHKSQMVHNPPTLREIDGQWFIVITNGKVEMLAPVGTWFAAQFFARVVLPALVLDGKK